MNVTNKTTRTYSVSELTEAQAGDLLETCITLSGKQNDFENDFTLDEFETANNLRQALLNAGVKPRGQE